jgi:hypothetical protein
VRSGEESKAIALREEAQQIRNNARTAKDKGDPAWRDWHAKLKEVYKQMHELERAERRGARRMLSQRHEGRSPESKMHGVRERQANAPPVSTNAVLGTARQEVSREVTEFREQLGCSVFMGGVPQKREQWHVSEAHAAVRANEVLRTARGNTQRPSTISQICIHKP